jgi:hypothetical protein
MSSLVDIAAGLVMVSGCSDGSDPTPRPPPPPLPTILNLEDGQAAEVVIGQANFVDVQANRGGAPDANTLAGPYGTVALSDGRMYVPDYLNNRILGFNDIPDTNGATANFVLGQVDFTETAPGVARDRMDGPQAPHASGSTLLVADYNSNRVLIYNDLPGTGPASADVAVGQVDLDSSSFGCSDSALDSPETAVMAGERLVVTDTRNHRVLIWNTLPTRSGQPADIVLGQPNFDTCVPNNDATAGGPSARTFNEPAGAWGDASRLVVIDSLNNRVLIWNSFPSENHAPANVVIGQSNFSNTAFNDVDQDGISDGGPDSRTLSYPYDGIDFNGEQLCVADSDNNRVLVWDSIPTGNFAPADRVIGQPDFVSDLPNDSTGDGSGDDPGPATLDSPNGCFFNATRFVVGDQDNNRILIYRAELL